MQAAKAKEEAGRRERAEMEQGILDADARLSALHARVLEDTRSAQIQEGDANLLRERIASAKKEAERLAQEREKDESQRSTLARQQQESRGKQEKYARDLAEIRARIRDLEGQAEEAAQDVAAREETIERGKEEMIRSFNALSDVKSAQARLAATREGLQARLDALENGAQERADALKAASAEREKAEALLRAAQETCGELEGARDRAMDAPGRPAGGEPAARRQHPAHGRRAARGAVAPEDARADAARLRGIPELRARGAAGASAARRGSTAWSRGCCACPRRSSAPWRWPWAARCRTSSCAREEDAKVMIEYLRQNRMGRATFLPLSSVRGRVLSPAERQVLQHARLPRPRLGAGGVRRAVPRRGGEPVGPHRRRPRTWTRASPSCAPGGTPSAW